MLVTPLPYGRMGNRLLLAAHFLAHAEEHGGSYFDSPADYRRGKKPFLIDELKIWSSARTEFPAR